MSAFALHYLYKGSRDFSRVAAVFFVFGISLFPFHRRGRLARDRRVWSHETSFPRLKVFLRRQSCLKNELNTENKKETTTYRGTEPSETSLSQDVSEYRPVWRSCQVRSNFFTVLH